jgi:hypothetical protein
VQPHGGALERGCENEFKTLGRPPFFDKENRFTHEQVILWLRSLAFANPGCANTLRHHHSR